MSKQTLKFNGIVLNKTDYYASKKAIPLNLINIHNIAVSYRVKHGDEGYKYFIVYSHDDDVIRPLCVILPQISGYIKYFNNGGDESVYLKYAGIWNKVKSY